MSLKTGDIVKLKSGGPEMTVFELWKNNKVICQWLNDGKLEKSKFDQDVLKKIDGSEVGNG